MYYKLHENIGLRGWGTAPYTARHFPSGETEFIGEDFWGALSLCDGSFDCDSPLLTPLHRQLIGFAVKKGVALPCEKGEKLAEKQKYKRYPCQYIETAHWSITGKCNMRCRHCYMSAPTGLPCHLSTGQTLHILREIASAGATALSLTGGVTDSS